MRRILSFIVILSLAAPAVASANVCCREHDPATVSLTSETCGCPSAAMCAGEAAAESLLEARLAAPASSHRTPTVLLAMDRHRVRSLTGSRPFRLASARALAPTPITITLPLRL